MHDLMIVWDLPVQKASLIAASSRIPVAFPATVMEMGWIESNPLKNGSLHDPSLSHKMRIL